MIGYIGSLLVVGTAPESHCLGRSEDCQLWVRTSCRPRFSRTACRGPARRPYPLWECPYPLWVRRSRAPVLLLALLAAVLGAATEVRLPVLVGLARRDRKAPGLAELAELAFLALEELLEVTNVGEIHLGTQPNVDTGQQPRMACRACSTV